MGDGTTIDSTTPVQVSGLTGVVGIAAGCYHNLALKSDGTVWAWGRNYYGQLGDGTTNDSSTPVEVSGLTDVVGIAAGFLHSLAVRSDETVWTWGADTFGQLGDGPGGGNKSTPVQAVFLTGVARVAGGERHSLALKSDGSVWAWGDNVHGQLGNGIHGEVNWPVRVSGLSGVDQIAAGRLHSLAVKSDGTAWAWGWNEYGQLGDGTVDDRSIPVQVVGLTDIVGIAGGRDYSLLLGPPESPTAPIVLGTWPEDDACEAGVQYAVVAFDELVINVSADDLVLSGGTVTSVVGDQNGPYLFEITDAPLGTITATLDGDITDSNGNDLAAYQWSFVNQSFSGFDGDCDVDVTDIEVFAACISGPTVEHNGAPACLMADFDNDDDVDQSDFGIFQRCISGDGNTADPDCAD